jgi:Trypsin
MLSVIANDTAALLTRGLQQLACILGFGACLASNAAAEPVKAERNTGGIAMKWVPELGQSGTGPKLQGGSEAKSDDWPASFYSNAGRRCTATLVGPRALLMAAHCVGNSQDAAVMINSVEYIGPCTHSADYKDGAGDDSADYALCRLDKAVSGIIFETINLNAKRPKHDDELLLTGYGCTNKPGPGQTKPSGGSDGKYRVGQARVVAIAGERPNEPNTIITRDPVALCPGDSGGGAYLPVASRRVLVGVNSRVDFDTDESFIASVTSTIGREFLDTWLRENRGELICGLNFMNESCR